MNRLVAAILLGNGVGGRMATATHYLFNYLSIYLFIHLLI